MKDLKQLTRKLLYMGVLAAMMIVMAACGSNDNETNNETPVATAEVIAETVYPLTITDATDFKLTFEQAPTAIVSILPSETETIFAIGAGEFVVGVDSYSNYPPEAAELTQVGDFKTNIEAVIALNPDLVLASPSMNADAIQQLRALDIPVYASEPKSYDATIAKIEEIGKIVNKNAEAAEVADHMRQVKDSIAEAVKEAEAKRIYLEFSPGWTVGKGEFLDEMITLAGGLNIATESGWYEVNSEEVIKQNPQVIIYPDYGEEKSTILEGIESRPGWEVIDAVKNEQMFAVTNDTVVRVGPRLADALLELAHLIHPELVQQP